MKYYTVNLYNVRYEHPYRGHALIETADPIIIKKGLFHATELLTGQKIDILPNRALEKFNLVNVCYRNEYKYSKTGYHLVVLEEELVPKNHTTVQEIDSYVDKYEFSEFKTIYESIKEKTGAKVKPLTTTQKVKSVRNTKK